MHAWTRICMWEGGEFMFDGDGHVQSLRRRCASVRL
jgi:hypothetical protein